VTVTMSLRRTTEVVVLLVLLVLLLETCKRASDKSAFRLPLPTLA
jgi:hypothetical protein